MNISLGELLPLIAAEYKFVSSNRGFEEVFYIHPSSKLIPFTSINMSYYPVIYTDDVKHKVAILKLAVKVILEAVNGFIPEKELLKYLEQYICDVKQVWAYSNIYR
jgi:hypothetical protein